MIVGITDVDDRMLLGSNALWEANRFSLLAGFVEPGESLEAAVIREVREESGLRVVDPVYLGSQPWPFPASLMIGFRAHVPASESTTGTPDGDEILELRWFTRDELRDAAAAGEIILPGPTSIARAIIEDWYGDEVADGSRAGDEVADGRRAPTRAQPTCSPGSTPSNARRPRPCSARSASSPAPAPARPVPSRTASRTASRRASTIRRACSPSRSRPVPPGSCAPGCGSSAPAG